MVEKLKSVLKTAQSLLILKSFVFAGLLFWIKTSGFTTLPIVVFVLYSFLFYFYHRIQSDFENFYSFLVLIGASLYGVGMLSHLEFLLLAILVFSFLFYIFLGIKEHAFTHRFEWNYTKNLLLVYSVFLLYFLSDKYILFEIKFLAVFLILFLVVREWLFWLYQVFPKRYNLAALVFSFLMFQILWAVSLLPLGFINSATFMIVIFYLGMDFLINHFRGLVTKNLIIKNSIILFVSVFVIFFLTNWKI